MSVCLIVQRPDAQPGKETMDDDLYHAGRRFYFGAFADIGSSPSIQLLQSGILLATYEYGHGDDRRGLHHTLFLPFREYVFRSASAKGPAILRTQGHPERVDASLVGHRNLGQVRISVLWAVVVESRIDLSWRCKDNLPVVHDRNSVTNHEST
jgi:hypothetical protein